MSPELPNTRVGFEARDPNGKILYQDAEIKVAAGGERVNRVWGGDAGPNGEYWTPRNAASTPDYRGAAGLPNGNTGDFLSSGTMKPGTVYVPGNATPTTNTYGGLPEYRISNPQDNVKLDSVTMPDEPY